MQFAFRVYYTLYMFLLELLIVTMCLHPKTDIVNSIATNAHDWDITDDCNYLYQIKNIDSDDLVTIQINIRGILSKLSLLKNLIDNSTADRCPDVIIVSETWLTPTSPSVKITGYKFVHKCRQDRKGLPINLCTNVGKIEKEVV